MPLWQARAGRLRRARLAQVGGPGGAVRRPRPRAAPDQGSLPRRRRGGQGAPRLRHRDRRDRQVPARLGVLQVLRRHRGDRLLAPRPLPALRRGRHVLGARGHGADALPDRRGRGAGRRAREAARDPRGAHPRRGGARVRRAAPGAAARASSSTGRATGRTSSRPGGSSSSGSPTPIRRCSSSRTCSGPTRACSTSSSTCSTGRAITRCFVVTLGAAGAARAAADLGRRPAQLHLDLPGAAGGEGDEDAARRARARPSRRRCAIRSSPARRACRCTRSRPCACCSTAACSSQEGAAYRVAGEVESLEVPETLHALIAARLDGLSPDERRLLEDAAVLGKSFTRDALAALVGRRRRASSSRCSRRSCARRCSACRPIRARPSTASTASCRISSATSPTRRSRGASAAAATSRRPIPDGGAPASEDEVIEVVASHYVDAYEAMPDADDAAELKRRAGDGLAQAGERAASLAAATEARRYFEQAAELIEEPAERARAARASGRDGVPRGRSGHRAHTSRGVDRAATRAWGTRTGLPGQRGSLRLRAGLGPASTRESSRWSARSPVISQDQPDEDAALLAARLGLYYWFQGDLERSAERAELALDIAEAPGYASRSWSLSGVRERSRSVAAIRRKRPPTAAKRSRSRSRRSPSTGEAPVLLLVGRRVSA